MSKVNTTTSRVFWTFPLEIIAEVKQIAESRGVKSSVLATQIFREWLDRNRTIKISIE